MGLFGYAFVPLICIFRMMVTIRSYLASEVTLKDIDNLGHDDVIK